MMRAQTKIIVLFLLIGLSLSSCYDLSLKCIRGNNNVIEEVREVDFFTKITLAGACNVIIEYDTINEVKIEAEENLIQYIETDVTGDKLIIDQREDRCLRTNFPIIVRIKTTELTAINLTGSGDMVCDSISTEYFEIDLIGSGNIELELYGDFLEADLVGSGEIRVKGEVTETDLSIPGSGNIKTADLIQETCTAEIAGSGSIYVNVSEYLDALISGSGNIYYVGYPEIDSQITGSGNIISINEN